MERMLTCTEKRSPRLLTSFCTSHVPTLPSKESLAVTQQMVVEKGVPLASKHPGTGKTSEKPLPR